MGCLITIILILVGLNFVASHPSSPVSYLIVGGCAYLVWSIGKAIRDSTR